jgi:hypothetical protein
VIARTTAYRYFPNQRDLLVAAYPDFVPRSLLRDRPPEDIEARLEAVVGEYLRLPRDNEAALRAALRLARDPARALLRSAVAAPPRPPTGRGTA